MSPVQPRHRKIIQNRSKPVSYTHLDFQSEAFTGYLMYSVNSSPLKEKDYITMEDRQILIEDFRNHLVNMPALINTCIENGF